MARTGRWTGAGADVRGRHGAPSPPTGSAFGDGIDCAKTRGGRARADPAGPDRVDSCCTPPKQDPPNQPPPPMPATQEATPSAIGDQLRALIRLQHIDSRIDQITKLRGDLPEEIRDLEDEKAGLETRIQKMRDEQADSEMRRKRNDLDVAESEGLIRKYEEQQLQRAATTASTTRSPKRSRPQRNRIEQAKMENEALLMRDELNMGQVSEAEVRLKELDAVLTEKRGELDRVVADTEEGAGRLREAARLPRSRTSRPATAAPTSASAAASADGRAVVPLDRGSAAGYSVPPQRQVEIRQRNRIIPCEHTGRIIVDDTLWDEIVADM